MGSEDAGVRIKYDCHGQCAGKGSCQIGRKKSWIRFIKKGPSGKHIEEGREENQLHMLPGGLADRDKHADDWVLPAELICKM